MSIYDLDIKGIRKTLRDFGATTYGRTVFLIAYFIPLIAFLVSLISLAISFATVNGQLLKISAVALTVFVISFMPANAYYYRELKEFVKEKRK